MKGVIICFLACFFLLARAGGYHLEVEGGLAVQVNSDGSYEILVDNVAWFSSQGGGFYSGGTWYDIQAGTLKLQSTTPIKGNDGALGAFTGVDLMWTGGSFTFHTIFQTFAETGAIVFNQYFPGGIPDTTINTNTDVLSSFPTLTNATALNFFTYVDWPTVPIIGEYLNGFPSTAQGGGPALFYNNNLRSVIFSPLSNQMVGMQTKSKHYSDNLAFGLNGKIMEIPANFTHRTILVAGQGINNTFYGWGSTVLAYSGKQRSQPDSDVLIQYLGYWTDNGAYYYYNTEKNKTYADTMIDVYKYITNINLPVRSYQFDSWWYFKGINDGVTLWEPMPSIFPEGMLDVDENMGLLPLALHNRYFAPDNQYLQNYSFAVEKEYALPLDEGLFTHIMSKAKSWGMVLYEQDWLVTTYTEMNATQNNVTNARNWLMNMGNAAASLGLTIQYCMPLPLHWLQSVEIQPVTQSRVTGDYNPGNNQWQIGYPSILVWSLGVYPFKDDFWSNGVTQPGCPYSSCVEPNPVLETLVAALSSGPVGPSDSIGNLDVDLIMHTCTMDGLLLKADKPTTALDTVFLRSTPSNLLQVWDSFTQFGNNRWHYLLAAGLNQEYTVSAEDLELPSNVSSVVFEYFNFESGNQTVAWFNDSAELVIPNLQKTLDIEQLEAGVVPFRYYVIAPVLKSKWVLLGETSKFVTVSHQRISSLEDTPDYLMLTVEGTAGEEISLSFFNVATSSFSTFNATLTGPSLRVLCTNGCF